MQDLISRQSVIDAIDVLCQEHRYKIPGKGETYSQYNEAWQDALDRAEGAIGNLPSAEPEHTCVNCGRTANNGGWYADGRTRCPIEEHYALPKDGYCHLWEKRNFTDDDYPERRERMNQKHCRGCPHLNFNAMTDAGYDVIRLDDILKLPSIQSEIIRCKDCKHWIPYDWMFSEVWRSKNMADYPEDEIGCNWSDMAMKADDFCSRAERREVTS